MHSQMVKLDAATVAEAMLRRGMTRRDLQARGGLSHFTVWKACKAKELSLRSAKKIARALGVRIAALMAKETEGGSADEPLRIKTLADSAVPSRNPSSRE